MFGILRKRKTYIIAHWIAPIRDFESDTGQFYQSVKDLIVEQRLPGISIEEIKFSEGGFLAANRLYLRMRRELVVFDLCSAPFGKWWWFSGRSAVLLRSLQVWELLLFLLGLCGFAHAYLMLFGLWGGIYAVLASCGLLLLVFFAAKRWSGLDDFLIHLPVLGAIYEVWWRAETYFQQDQRIMFGTIVNTLIKEKVVEFCTAGGHPDPEFIEVDPQQILSERELKKYLGEEEEGNSKKKSR